MLEKKSFGDILEEIRTVYLSDNRPWIIGFSGGKDSTCMVQLVWTALSQLPPKKLQKKVYIISSNTLVEAPQIAERITDSLDRMEKLAKKINLPLGTNLLRPKTEDTFWVRLLGLGYPAPTIMFRWCTDMLKISNADRFIQDTVSEHGEAIVLLGTRKSESTVRETSMNLYKIENSVLSRHSKFDQTFVYTPIEDLSSEDVWNYLLENKNPWGEENRDLLAMYQDANASECPLVIDTTTPSCGGGRFGCWTCTVVDEQKYLINLIDSDPKNEWMEVLAELRQKLKDTQDSNVWEKYRERKRRSGRIDLKTHDGKVYCKECDAENDPLSTKCKNNVCSEPWEFTKKCKECGTENSPLSTKCKNNVCSEPWKFTKKCKECNAETKSLLTKCKNNVCSEPWEFTKKCKECGTENSPLLTKCETKTCKEPWEFTKKCKECGTENGPLSIKCKTKTCQEPWVLIKKCVHCKEKNDLSSIKCEKCNEYLTKYTPGPYKMEFRIEYLKELLKGQLKIQKIKKDPEMELILEEEIHEIQRIWRMEQGDWKNTAYSIYQEITGKNLNSIQNELGNFDETEQKLLEDTCSTHNISFKLVSNLLNLELKSQGANRHSKIFDKIRSELSKEWRDLENKEEFEIIMEKLKVKKDIQDKIKPTPVTLVKGGGK